MSARSKSYNLSIQGLKGLSALVVFLSHGLNIIQNNVIQEIGRSPFHILFDGQCSVIIFFVISGFFYYRESPIDSKGYIKLIKKKFIRIYPAYIFTLYIAFLLCNLQLSYNHSICTSWANQFWQSDVPFSTFLKQLPIITPGFNPNILNPPVWYLRAEVRMALVMPLIVSLYVFLKHRYRKIPSAVIITSLLFSSFVVSGMVCFMIGYSARLLAQKYGVTIYKKMWPIFLVVGLFLLNIRNEFDFETTQFTDAIQAVGASMIIILCFYKGFGLLQQKIMVSLGEISYEIFLTHSILLLFIRCFVEDYWCFVCLSFCSTLILSLIINKLQTLLQNALCS